MVFAAEPMKTIADYPLLHEALSNQRSATTPSPLNVRGEPKVSFDAKEPDWLTSDEAVAAGALELTEVNEAGSVPAPLIFDLTGSRRRF